MGPDNLHPHLLKLCADKIYDPITCLFNYIMNTQLIPQEWKIHKIIPVPKKGDLTLTKNYRPISLLSILSKVLERLVYDKIIDFVKPKISSSQFGFLKHRSSLTQLLSSYSQVVDALNSGNSCNVVYLDLAKAFDKVPHKELLFKLWMLGITGNLWKWFQNYLVNRSHFVQFNASRSDALPVLSGVPQGSILGPLLFIIYINDMPNEISLSSIYVFADDTKLIKRQCTQDDLSILQSDLNNLLNWCNKWSLALNASKCIHIKFGHCTSSSHLELGELPIKLQDSHKDLGITVQSALSWTPHINTICQKAYCSLGLIRRNTQVHHNRITKRKLYITLVRSNLTYCSQLWRPHLHKNISKIEKIQRRATKYILNNSTLDYKSRLINTHLLPMMYWLELQDTLFLIKCFQNKYENFDITNYLSFSSTNTRSSSSSKLTYKFSRTNTTRHFYFSRITKLWNSLPPIDLSLSFNSLKAKLYDHFWSHFLTNFNSTNICSYHTIMSMHQTHVIFLFFCFQDVHTIGHNLQHVTWKKFILIPPSPHTVTVTVTCCKASIIIIIISWPLSL